MELYSELEFHPNLAYRTDMNQQQLNRLGTGTFRVWPAKLCSWALIPSLAWDSAVAA